MRLSRMNEKGGVKFCSGFLDEMRVEAVLYEGSPTISLALFCQYFTDEPRVELNIAIAALFEAFLAHVIDQAVHAEGQEYLGFLQLGQDLPHRAKSNIAPAILVK